jgi:hypothetical protein
MGQYHKVFNLDAKQKVNPHACDDGIKLMEFGSSAYGTLSAMALLLAKGAGYQGPWAGQRIVVSGDYADEGRFVPETHAHLNLYSYDQNDEESEGEEQEGGESAQDERPDRYAEASDIARSLGASVLREGHPFVTKSRRAPGADQVMSDDTVFTTPEELLEAMGATLHEDLTVSIQDVQRTLRCGNLVSVLGWNYRPKSVTVVESEDQERIESICVSYTRDRGEDGPANLKQTLAFPATAAQVRSFLKIEGRAPSRY